jgi:hypothetical protein
MMENAPLDELRTLFLRFCSAREVAALRTTCRAWTKRIPFAWIVDDVYVTDRLDLNSRRFFTQMGVCMGTHDLDGSYPFLERFTVVSTASLRSLDLPTSSTERLQSLTLTSIPALQTLRVRAQARRLEDLFCNHAPALQTLDLSPACVRLQSILVSNTPKLTPFTLAPSWSSLRHLGLVNVNLQWTRLVIPATYVSLKSVNVSGSAFSEMEYYACIPIEIPRVCIQAHNLSHVTRLRITTRATNQNRLWVTTSLPVDFDYNLKGYEASTGENDATVVLRRRYE